MTVKAYIESACTVWSQSFPVITHSIQAISDKIMPFLIDHRDYPTSEALIS